MSKPSVTASNVVSLYRPSPCDLRIYLRSNEVPEAEPSPYAKLIMELGREHELRHLSTFPAEDVVDISQVDPSDRVEETRMAVSRGAAVIYQCAMDTEVETSVGPAMVSGYPDFMLRRDGGYAIRDLKISRRISMSEHPEIFAQLGMYSMLFESTFQTSPVALEVHAGSDEIVPIENPAMAIERALESIDRVARAKELESAPFEPVGWSKCQSCGFTDHCWNPAVDSGQVGIVPALNQKVALQLHERGFETVQELLTEFDESKLIELKGVGEKSARTILRNARALDSAELDVFAPIEIPEADSYVMFDLEGIPPHLENNEKIYIWGVKVYGAGAGDFMPAVAGFDERGDEEGWFAFLKSVENIVSEHGRIPFVHWAVYEKTMINRYVERYGDPNGTAAVLRDELLLDLLPITKASVALPIPSLSLKVVEKFVGFERGLPESNGDWAIVQFIKAAESGDDAERDQLVAEVLQYNEEDLEATWAVFEWLRELARG